MDYQDFSSATAWERLSAQVELTIRRWSAGGQGARPIDTQGHTVQIATLDHALECRTEPYTLTLYQSKPPVSPSENSHFAESRAHKLQQWFGVESFLILAPATYSGRFLDQQEAGTLLSALSVALSSCQVPWPAFIPVHDPRRDGYQGVAIAGRGMVHFETDSIHLSKIPAHLLTVEGQLNLFAARLQARDQLAASACDPDSDADQSVTVSVRQCFSLPQPSCRQAGEAASDDEFASFYEPAWSDREWDAEAPWRPWAMHNDPLGGLDLKITWQRLSASHLAAHETLQPQNAADWHLHVLDPMQQDLRDEPGFFQPAERARAPLSIAQALQPGQAPSADACSFAYMLGNLLRCAEAADSAQAMGQMSSADWWEAQGILTPNLPPDDVMQRILRDIFVAPQLPSFFGTRSPDLEQAIASVTQNAACAEAFPQQNASLRAARAGLPRTAPPDSLASRLALHTLTFGNARAVAQLWQRFVRELRFAHWEASTPLPRMGWHAAARPATGVRSAVQQEGSVPPGPDLYFGLLHQKLQMLNVCIHHRRRQSLVNPLQQQEQQQHGFERQPLSASQQTQAQQQHAPNRQPASELQQQEQQQLAEEMSISVPASQSAASEYASCSEGDPDSNWDWRDEADHTAVIQPDVPHNSSQPAQASSSSAGEGIAGPLGDLRLSQHPGRCLQVPLTQQPPQLTEDMLLEREAALAALGHDEAGNAARARLQGQVLSSDMAAFKAANPGSILCDFVRWHSPNDWLPDNALPLSGKLSPRMASEGGMLQRLWEAAQPCPATAQKPLLDAEREGERVLDWLDTLPPSTVVEELLGSALSSALALLARCSGALLPRAAASLNRFQAAAAGHASRRASASRGYADLLDMLRIAEVLVVSSEALVMRLPDSPQLASRALTHIMQPLRPDVQPAESRVSHNIDASGESGDSSLHGAQQQADQAVAAGSEASEESLRGGDVQDQPVRSKADVSSETQHTERQRQRQNEPDRGQPSKKSHTAHERQRERGEREARQPAQGLSVSTSADKTQIGGLLQQEEGSSSSVQVALSQACSQWVASKWTELVYEVGCSSGDGPRHRMYVRSAPRELRVATAIASHAASVLWM